MCLPARLLCNREQCADTPTPPGFRSSGALFEQHDEHLNQHVSNGTGCALPFSDQKERGKVKSHLELTHGQCNVWQMLIFKNNC